MSPTIRTLAETDHHRLYAVYESVFVNDRRAPDPAVDTHLVDIHGDPDSGLVSACGRYVAVAGCGLTICPLSAGEPWSFGSEADAVLWTEAVHQSGDDPVEYVRFVARTADGRLRVHRLHAFDRIVEVLER